MFTYNSPGNRPLCCQYDIHGLRKKSANNWWRRRGSDGKTFKKKLSKLKIMDEEGEEVMINFQETFKPELSGARALLVGT